MFRYLDTRRQLLEERRKNARLTEELAKTNANVEFLAMMTDVNMDEGEDEDMTMEMEVTDDE